MLTKQTKVTAIFNLVVGASMALMWLMFYVTDSIPELETAPYDIAMHLIAEGITAGLLIASGVLLLKQCKKALFIYFIAYGALLYSIVNSSGYFLDPFDVAMTAMFLILIIASTILTVIMIRKALKTD